MNLPFYRLKLEEAGVAFGPGLTDAEVQAPRNHMGSSFHRTLGDF